MDCFPCVCTSFNSYFYRRLGSKWTWCRTSLGTPASMRISPIMSCARRPANDSTYVWRATCKDSKQDFLSFGTSTVGIFYHPPPPTSLPIGCQGWEEKERYHWVIRDNHGEREPLKKPPWIVTMLDWFSISPLPLVKEHPSLIFLAIW